jgi:hypothetical protein
VHDARVRSLALVFLAASCAASAAQLGRTHMSPTATGSGTAMVTFTGGGPDCQFSYAQFVPLTGTASSPTDPAPKGVTFPHGMFDFAVSNCEPGASLAFTITYPKRVAGASYWKYGPTADNAKHHWYAIPAKFEADAVTFTLVDGGIGDDDLKRDGRVVDPGGPGALDTSIDTFTLGPWPLWLLVTLLGVIGLHPRPRQLLADGVAKTMHTRREPPK